MLSVHRKSRASRFARIVTQLISLPCIAVVFLAQGDRAAALGQTAKDIQIPSVTSVPESAPKRLEDLYELIDAELHRLATALSPEEYQRARQEVALLRGGGANINVVAAHLASVRFYTRRRLNAHMPFNSAVTSQFHTLAKDATSTFITLRQLHPQVLPLSDGDILSACLQAVARQPQPALSPYFRLPMSQASIDAIHDRFRQLEEQERVDVFWADEPRLTREQILGLAKAYVRQTIRDIVIQRSRADTNLDLWSENEDLRALSAQPPAVAPAPHEAVPSSAVGEFGLADIAIERVYALVLSMIPLLNQDGGGAEDDDRLRTADAVVTLHTLCHPQSRVRVYISTAASRHLWLFLITSVESDNGALLAEQQLRGRCFIYDRNTADLREYAYETKQADVLCGHNLRFLEGALYFLSPYRCNDLRQAMYVTDSVATLFNERAVLCAGTSYLADRRTLPFLNHGERYNVALVHGEGLELQFPEGRLTACARRDAHPTTLSNAAFPPIHLKGRLASGDSATPGVGTLQISRRIFGTGVELTCTRNGIGQELVRVLARDRLDATALVAFRPHDNVAGSPTQDAGALAEHLASSSPLYAVEKLVDDLVRSRPAGACQLDTEEALLAIDATQRAVANIPAPLQMRMTDLKFALHLSVKEAEQAIAAFSEQSQLLKTCSDRGFADSYVAFCSNALHNTSSRQATAPQPYTEYSYFCKNRGGESQRKRSAILSKPSLQGAGDDSGDRAIADDLELRSKLKRTVRLCFDSEMCAFAEGQIDSLWRTSQFTSSLDGDSIERLLEHWQRSCSRISSLGARETQASEFATLIWRTYHFIHVLSTPVRAAVAETRDTQVSELERCIYEVEDEVMQAMAPRDTELVELRDEAERSVGRLRMYCGSPWYPIMYYPLEDDRFRQALSSVRSKILADVGDVQREYDRLRAQRITQALGPDSANARIDFEGRELRRWLKARLRAVVGLTMGNIVRQYGIIHRDIDYTSPTWSANLEVRGVSAIYKMQDGLDFEVHVDWAFAE